jgi:uncharacterized membrane protein
MGIALATWRGHSALTYRDHRRPWRALAVGVVFGGLAFMNAWDVITFCALLAVAVAARNFRRERGGLAIANAAGWLLPVVAAGIVAYLPWYTTFTSQASGLYPYIGEGTLPGHAFLQFGVPIAIALCVLPFALRVRGGTAIDALAAGLWLPLLPLLGWLLFAAARGELSDAVSDRGGLAWYTLLAYAAAAWLLGSAAWLQVRRNSTLAMTAGLGALAALLLYGTELFYIGDIFKDSIPRQNTVFKLSYQAWIVFAVAGPAALALALRQLSGGLRAGWPGLAALPATALAAAGLVYPVLSVANRTDGFDAVRHTDGLGALALSQPDEYAMTRWVEASIPPGDTILEASGRRYMPDAGGAFIVDPAGPRIDYGEPGRVSARTGRQTPIGWPGHEAQWRGTSAETGAEIAERQQLVDEVYLTGTPAAMLDTLDRLGARWVVVGRVERERYPIDLDARFGGVLELAFESGNTRVYMVPVFRALETS